MESGDFWVQLLLNLFLINNIIEKIDFSFDILWWFNYDRGVANI